MKTMSVILIDPAEKNISTRVIEYSDDRGKLKSLQKLVDCQLLDKVELDCGTHDLVVDEEFLYADPLNFFILPTLIANRLFAGKSLVVGLQTAKSGAVSWSDCALLPEAITKDIKYLTREEAVLEARRIDCAYDEYLLGVEDEDSL